MMSSYSNTNVLVYQDGTLVYTCYNNTGNITFGRDSKLKVCSRNNGTLRFGEHSQIESIKNNRSYIYIGDNSRITSVKGNKGFIFLGNNCFLDNVTRNLGYIIAGPGTAIVNGVTYGGRIIMAEIPHGQAAPLGSPPLPVPVAIRRNMESPTPTIIRDAESPSLPIRQITDGPPPMEDSSCVVCISERRDTAFSCGHVCCERCAKTLTKCHMCREIITQRIKLFL